MKKLFLLSILFSISFITVAQKNLSDLTAHEGRWFLFSERIEEQSFEGQFLARETYFDQKDISSINLSSNGICSMTDSNNQKATFRWKLSDENKIELYDAKSEMKYTLEILKITANELVVRYFEDLGDYKVAKLSTYCFPNNRLPKEEINKKNEVDVFNIEGFTSMY